MSNRKIVGIALLGVILWGAAIGQEDLSRELNRARSLERQGRRKEAVKIYEELHRSHPKDLKVWQLLSNGYLATKRYDDLIRLSEWALKTDPNSLVTLRYLGQAYLGKGDTEKGAEVAERIIGLDPGSKMSYQFAAALFTSSNRFDEAIDAYLKGRKVLGDEKLFARDLAFVYQRKGDYEKATSELLSFLRTNSRSALWVERELKSMLKRGDPKKIIGVVERASRGDTSPELHRILGDIYLSEGRYQAAASEYESSGGVDALLQLGMRAEEEGLFQIAVDTQKGVLQTSTDPKVKAAASLRLGASLRRLGKYDEALKTLDSAASRYPWIWGEALYEMGMIYLMDLKEPRKAVSELEKLFRRPKESKSVDAGLSLVECYLSIGDLRKAEETCERLSPLKPDRATFLLAEIHYYRGDFDKALELYMAIVEGHKESEVVNDALERVLLIGENQGEELRDFARAELLGVEGKYDAGIGVLREIIGRSSPGPLVPRATFLLGDLLKGKGEVHQAIGAYRDLISNYPESPLCPYAKLKVAEIYASELKDKKKGIRELEGLLLEYPNSVLCELARERIEELKGL